MRQTHPLTHPRHKPAQAVDRVKSRIRKYLKRERRKALPEGADYWDFDCRIGETEAGAKAIGVGDIVKQIGTYAEAGAEAVYVEILAKPGHRAPKQDPAD